MVRLHFADRLRMLRVACGHSLFDGRQQHLRVLGDAERSADDDGNYIYVT